MRLEEIIKRPLILTEKGARLRESENKVMFEVSRDANKIEIKKAIEKLFNVSVVDVNTLVVRGAMKRMGRGYSKTKNWKKAIVTLKEGDAIEVFGGA